MPEVVASSTSPHWLRRILAALVFLCLTIIVAGFLYENISEARDRRFNPMPGQLVDVNGLHMHIDCSGQGAPTVVLDSGLGDSYVSWRKVQPEIAKFTRVCSYDRAGLGYSDSTPQPRTSKVIAEQLHALLQAAGVAPPYIMVGHSMGGYDVRLFASLYRDEVVGMVLVDASHPDQEHRFTPELRSMEGSWMREAEFLAYATPFGIPRLLSFCESQPIERAADCNFHSAREGLAELKAFPQSAAEAAATGPFGDMPLIVLSHDPDKPSAELPAEVAKSTNEAWEKMQEELAHLSTRGSRQVAKGSAHYIQNDRPDIVIAAVRDVLNQTRSPQSVAAASHASSSQP
ncbi:MAG TPA: alpha/beta hydrolase [Verrucomicrobiae bacterium]|nr:alpha/beta hydrolase [Verrucomicrobiae bacterium]